MARSPLHFRSPLRRPRSSCWHLAPSSTRQPVRRLVRTPEPLAAPEAVERKAPEPALAPDPREVAPYLKAQLEPGPWAGGRLREPATRRRMRVRCGAWSRVRLAAHPWPPSPPDGLARDPDRSLEARRLRRMPSRLRRCRRRRLPTSARRLAPSTSPAHPRRPYRHLAFLRRRSPVPPFVRRCRSCD